MVLREVKKRCKPVSSEEDRRELTGSKGHNQSEEISEYLAHLKESTQVAPLLVAGVAHRESGQWVLRGGSSERGPSAVWGEQTVTESAVIDLASITKSFFAVLVSQLALDGTLPFETQLQEVLPEVRGSWGGTQTIEALLSHRSGLAAHVELFAPSWHGHPVKETCALWRAASSVSPNRDFRPVYSDLGYILVGAAVERLLSTDLDRLIAERVALPWHLRVGSARAFRRAQGGAATFVPTEIQMGRGGRLVGAVHDDNAWALRGSKICGHAGLFGTLEGVLRFGCLLLDGVHDRNPQVSPLLPPLLRRRPGSSLRLGLDGVSGKESSAGQKAGENTFGHLGFTGTSLWCDPDRDRVTVFLCNRVAPTRTNLRIRAVRPKIHDFLWAC